MMIIKKKVWLQISRRNSKCVLHRLKRAWWIQEFQQPEEKNLLSSPSAWRKTLHASYSRQQWDEQGALEVGGCLLRTSDVLDSFNYLQHSFNVLGLVGAQTSPSRCHFRFTFGSARDRFWKPAKQRSLFFVRWWWVFLKGIYMHSAQGGTCRIKIQAEQDPPINTHALKETAEQQKICLCGVHSGYFRGLWRICLAVGIELHSHQTRPSDFRVGPTSRGRTVQCRVIWRPASSSELLIFFAALGGGANLKGGLVTGGAAPALKGWCISFRYSPQRFWI